MTGRTKVRTGSVRALGTLLASTLFLVSQVAAASETLTYNYDALGRLINVSRAGTVNNGKSETYSYDRAGNRLNVTVADTLILYAGQSMYSPDGRFMLSMQTDGNLVWYGPSGAMWWTGTNGGSDRRMVMQSDGNLVVYNGANQGLWASNTSGNFGSRLALQNDGNLVIYTPLNAAIWASNTVYQPPCTGVSFTIASNGAVTEGASSVFTVTKSGSTANSCTVNYATANGTATAPGDFTAASGTLTFTSAQASQTVTVATIDDTAVESPETFSMALSAPSGSATLGSPSSATATINDNDNNATCSGISFSISDASANEGGTLVFTVTKSGSTSVSCSVNYATANGTATAGSLKDYFATSGTLTFTAAQTSLTVSVTTRADSLVEPDETMFVNLSGPTSPATIINAQATGTIFDQNGGGGGGSCPQNCN